MKKIYTPIFSTFIFLLSAVNPSAYASDLTIPANSNCEVRLSNSSEYKENKETAFISCESKNKVDNNNVNQVNTRVDRKHTGDPSQYPTLNSYHSSSSPTDTRWWRFSSDADGKSI